MANEHLRYDGRGFRRQTKNAARICWFFGLRTIGDVILRAFAMAASTANFGGRYHELNPIVDGCMAAAFGGVSRLSRNAVRAPSAVERWGSARRAAPDLAVCHYRLAAELRKTGAFDCARDVIEAALSRFPDDLGTAIEAARSAELQREYVEAAGHWQRVLAMAKPRPGWIAAAVHALACAGRVDEAETLLAPARVAHPNNALLMAGECVLAMRKRDWSKTVHLSREIRRRFPQRQDLVGELVYAETLSKIDEIVNDPPVAPTTRTKLGTVKNEEVRQLLLRFESIGDNCEFGLVQRRFGAEPLGLFRWNRVDAHDLVAALDHRLEGLGEPEHTEMILTERGEFYVLDRRWFFGVHTYQFRGQTTHEELFPAMLRRTVALRQRFIEDLAAGEKTFVFLSSGLDRKTLLDLHRALGSFGPARLLAVQPAKASVPDFGGRPGDIVVVEPGCYIGFLRKRGLTADRNWDIAFDDWIAICRKAEAAAADERSAAPCVPTA